MRVSVEYLVSALLFLALISIITLILIPNIISYVIHVEEGQLQVEAEKILTQILLSPGDPPDWGVSATYPYEIRVFGLARYKGLLYELDMNKLIRIYENSIENITDKCLIDVDNIARLLGIEGRYGFSLSLTPVLNVTIRIANDSEYCFMIKVTTHEEIPVPNVNVTAIFLTAYIDHYGDENATFYVRDQKFAVTDYNGVAYVDFSELSEELADRKLVGWSLIIYADFYGIKSVASYSNDTTLFGIILSNYLYIGHIEEILNVTGRHGGGAVHLHSAVALVTPESIETVVLSRVLPITPIGSARPYVIFEIEGLEDKALMAVFVIKNKGRYKLAVAYRVPLHFRVGVPLMTSSPVARGVHLRRIVLVEGYLYYLDFTLWRLSEW